MPDHLHLLITVGGDMPAGNPVKAGLADSSGNFPYCFTYLAANKATVAKALKRKRGYGTAEAMP